MIIKIGKLYLHVFINKRNDSLSRKERWVRSDTVRLKRMQAEAMIRKQAWESIPLFCYWPACDNRAVATGVSFFNTDHPSVPYSFCDTHLAERIAELNERPWSVDEVSDQSLYNRALARGLGQGY